MVFVHVLCYDGKKIQTKSAALKPVLYSTVGCYLENLLRADRRRPGGARQSAQFPLLLASSGFLIDFACALVAASCPCGMIQSPAR